MKARCIVDVRMEFEHCSAAEAFLCVCDIHN